MLIPSVKKISSQTSYRSVLAENQSCEIIKAESQRRSIQSWIPAPTALKQLSPSFPCAPLPIGVCSLALQALLRQQPLQRSWIDYPYGEVEITLLEEEVLPVLQL
jgi:hypothetical protein